MRQRSSQSRPADTQELPCPRLYSCSPRRAEYPVVPRYFPQRAMYISHRPLRTGTHPPECSTTRPHGDGYVSRSRLRARNQLKQRTCPGAVLVGNLAGCPTSQFGNSIGEAVLARLCDNNFAVCHRLCRQQGRDRSDTKGLERSTTTQNRHFRHLSRSALEYIQGGTLCESVYD